MPENRFGEEAGLEGEAYGGLVVFSRAKWRYREYLSSAELTRALAPGEWVCVSVWLVRGGDCGHVVADGIGVAVVSMTRPRGERDFHA